MKWKTAQEEVRPGWVGCGVDTPLPAVVVVDGLVVVVLAGLLVAVGGVVVEPMTPTQTFTPDHMPEQSASTLGFQRTKSASVMDAVLMIWLHVTPTGTKENLLQVLTMPAWVGWGVDMPVPALVVVGVEVVVSASSPMMLTQA
jgi:hypothetical protein